MNYDYVIIGSGFGGSVSALRLSEKGYKVLVLEKGKWWKAEDFPESNWNIRNWLWDKRFGLKGFMKITFLNHITALSGVGVGGGSLTYANTLPVPDDAFFDSGSWKGIQDWKTELSPFYDVAYQMLGATTNTINGPSDKAIKQLAKKLGISDTYAHPQVGIYLGKPGETVSDPYFDGKGPDRTGCIACGACMTGCKHNAKNTLDKNYLYLAQQLGAEIHAEHEVIDVVPADGQSGKTGYQVMFKSPTGKGKIETKGVVFAGGVLGTIPLLLKLKNTSLPNLSDLVGCQVRTNNEALINVVSKNSETDYSQGIAIGSIVKTDAHSHLEPCRYGEKSGFFKLLYVPMIFGRSASGRLLRMLLEIAKSPMYHLKSFFSRGYSTRTTILLFMQTLDSTLRIRKGQITPLKTELEAGTAPSAFIPEAKNLADEYAKIVNGKSFVGFTETLLGIPSTAHILGGAVMGRNAEEGVIDDTNHVFGYDHMLICDGSMISANPGVNPSLSITAISERAMALIPDKADADD